MPFYILTYLHDDHLLITISEISLVILLTPPLLVSNNLCVCVVRNMGFCVCAKEWKRYRYKGKMRDPFQTLFYHSAL